MQLVPCPDMLAGHYAPALLLKARYPELRLWVLFLAVQAVDIVFFFFAVTGIEFMSITGAQGPLNMNLEHVPLTHSLVMNIAFAIGCIAVGIVSKKPKLGLLVGAALLSHWMLDLVVHLPDLPLIPWQEPKVGLGFWRYMYPSLIFELLLLAGAFALWRRTVSPTLHRYADLGAAALISVQLSFVLGPSMPTVWAMAAMAEAIYVGFVVFAAGYDRRVTALGRP